MTFKKATYAIRVALVSISSLCFFASVGSAASYYVDATSGVDSNPGSISAPLKTVTKVNSMSLSPGDNVFFKRGGAWDTLLKPVSGTSGAPVSYAAYGSGNKPRIRGFYASSKAYVVAQDIEFRNGGADSPVTLLTSHHIAIRNCDLYADTTNTCWAAVYVLLNSHHNEISGCNVAHRNLNRQSDAINLRRNANYNLIKNNRIGIATHYSLSLEGFDTANPTYACNYNIIQNNIIYNPEGATMGLQSNSSNNVVEGNTIYGGKSTSYDANLPRSMKNVSRNNIIRYNIIRDNTPATASGLGMEVYAYTTDPPNVATGNHVYNNVITNIAKYPLVIATNGDAGAAAFNNNFKNNAVYNNAPVSGYQLWIMKHATIYDNFFSNNLFYKAGVSTIMNVQGKYTSVAGIQTSDPSHFQGNVQLDPKLDASFRPLLGSPCIDGGDFLTKVTSASGTGTVLAVATAGYFSDGLGIAKGDTIKVGSSTAVITAVDRATNRITVAEPVTWKTGDPVSLPYSGAKPDIGAVEYEQIVAQPLDLKFTN